MKRHLILLAIAAVFITFSPFSVAEAQTTVTFNINLKPQLENGDFIPDRGDMIELTGNITPPQSGTSLRMRDLQPIDSVYSVTVSFSRNNQGRTLSFNYVLTVDNEKITEESPSGIPSREEQSIWMHSISDLMSGSLIGL